MSETVGLEQTIAGLTGENWDFLKALDQRFGASPEARKKRELSSLQEKTLAAAASRVFAGRDGEIVLEWLLDQTWRRMEFPVLTIPDPGQLAIYGAFRSGQNAIVTTLLQAIAKGRGEDLTAPRAGRRKPPRPKAKE